MERIVVVEDSPTRVRTLPVLVVDDNATNRRILEELLLQMQMRPTAVDGAAAALDALDRARQAGEPFPLVLLDAHMPEMDGFALAERIQQHPELARARVMMLTSSGQAGDTARCRKLGVAAYLTKPVKQADLRKALLTALGTPAPANQQPPPAPKSPNQARHLRILLAEDNPVNQRLAVCLLEKHGCQVVVVDNGRAAVDRLDQQPQPFDLVLMDVQMPEMDGFEAAAAIRRKEQATGTRIPIIAMTAYAMKGDRQRCLTAGMDGYVSKPFRIADLYAVIDNLLPVPTPVATSAPRRSALAPALDWTVAMGQVDGNETLLRDLAALFLQEYPRWLGALGQAIAGNDAPEVKRVAHNLKGSLGTFGAKTAYDAALELEVMGRANDLTGAQAAYAALQEEMQKLKLALTELASAACHECPSASQPAPTLEKQ